MRLPEISSLIQDNQGAMEEGAKHLWWAHTARTHGHKPGNANAPYSRYCSGLKERSPVFKAHFTHKNKFVLNINLCRWGLQGVGMELTNRQTIKN